MDTYQVIWDQFNKLQSADYDKISNRVKLLIKNMISNKDSGWSKTEKKN